MQNLFIKLLKDSNISGLNHFQIEIIGNFPKLLHQDLALELF